MKKILFTATIMSLLVANSFADTVHYDIRKDIKPISKPNLPVIGTDTSGIKPNIPGSN